MKASDCSTLKPACSPLRGRRLPPRTPGTAPRPAPLRPRPSLLSRTSIRTPGTPGRSSPTAVDALDNQGEICLRLRVQGLVPKQPEVADDPPVAWEPLCHGAPLRPLDPDALSGSPDPPRVGRGRHQKPILFKQENSALRSRAALSLSRSVFSVLRSLSKHMGNSRGALSCSVSSVGSKTHPPA